LAHFGATISFWTNGLKLSLNLRVSLSKLQRTMYVNLF